MNLYLVQHGEAMNKEVDPVRPLSEGGRQDVTKVAEFVAKNCGMTLSRIQHSGKLRARQTAEIFAARFALPEPLTSDGLAPLDDPSIWSRRLPAINADIMLVGHLPHLAKLAGALLHGEAAVAPIAFRMGGIVALAREEGHWSLQWMVVPDMLA
jgi:phosphohistidine phosphatase